MREKRHHKHKHLPYVARSVGDDASRASAFTSSTPVASQGSVFRQGFDTAAGSAGSGTPTSTASPSIVTAVNGTRFNYSSANLLNVAGISQPAYNVSLAVGNVNISAAVIPSNNASASASLEANTAQAISSVVPVMSSITTVPPSATTLSDAAISMTDVLQAAASGAVTASSADASSSSSSSLSSTNKAVLGGVLGGLGGIGLVLAFALMMFSRSKRKRSASFITTPQRTIRKRSSSRFVTPVRVSSATTSRTRKNSEPPSPNNARSFQVISGRRLSSPPSFHGQLSAAGRTSISNDSSPRSNYTTPSRRSRLGGTSTVFRTSHLQDDLGRSHDNNSTISHVSRFVERLDDT